MHMNIVDKRIVMFSALTRRVRGVFIGHTRGIRCLSAYNSTLLSAGFECEARTWDMNSKDAVGILQGHRVPVRAAKLMCQNALSEKDYRAITVDESGSYLSDVAQLNRCIYHRLCIYCIQVSFDCGTSM